MFLAYLRGIETLYGFQPRLYERVLAYYEVKACYIYGRQLVNLV